MEGTGQEILVLAGTRKVDCESVAHLQVCPPLPSAIGESDFNLSSGHTRNISYRLTVCVDMYHV